MENITKFIEVYKSGTKPLPEIIQELKSTSSKNDKEAILKREQIVNNEELKQVLYWCYDPQFNFYTTKIPEYKTKREIYYATDALYQIVENVCSRKVTGNAALDYIAFVLANTVKTDTLIVESVIKRDLDCGVQKTTINKVWKDLINDPPYQQYSLMSEKLLREFEVPCFSQTKEDGTFSDLKVYKDSYALTSRQGKGRKFEICDELYKALLNTTQDLGEFVLHTEGLVKLLDSGGKWDGKSFLPRQEGNGLLESDNPPNELLFLRVWDMVTVDEYINRSCKREYKERIKELNKTLEYLPSDKIGIVDTRWCETKDDIINHFIEARETELEGTMVKSPNMLWNDNKTKKGLKLKNMFEAEYEVFEIQKHSKNPNLVGAIWVKTCDSKVIFKCGEGLSKQDRIIGFNIGDIVTIRGNDLSKAKNKETYAVSHARLVERRYDKTVADTYEKVLESRDSIIDLLKMIGVKK